MPVPVYLVYTAAAVMGEEGVLFTKGRMTGHDARGGSVGFLQSMNWKHVYHDSYVGQPGAANRADILNARHSEVLVPDQLGLEHLKWIVCRSAAEQETLLHCLDETTRDRWRKHIRLEGATRMFYKRGTFVQDVALTDTRMRLQFYTQTLGRDWRGPFTLCVNIDTDEGETLTHRQDGFVAEPAPVAIGMRSPSSGYCVRVTLDGALVYRGRFDRVDEPEVFT